MSYLLLLSTGQQHNKQTHFLQGGGAPTGHWTRVGYTASNVGQSIQPPYGYQPMAPAVLQSYTLLTEQHHSILLEKLTKYSNKWREIGLPLGFLCTELDNIQERPLLLSKAPASWLSAMLSEWVQWASGDGRGSTSFATLEGLKSALRKANLGAAAHDLSL